MDMTLRWYGEGNDSVTLEQIRQIPGVTGVITALHDIPAGEPWTYEDVMKRKQEVEAKGLKLVGIESINVHEDIKIGLPTRDKLIEDYCQSLEAVGKAGIHLVCYNFMPVFDWTRTDLAMPLADGSTALAYDSSVIDGINASEMFERIEKASGGFVMPGWEPNRRDEIMELFDKYKDVDADKLRENFKYFLDGIIPTCEKYKIKMAVHPDDPAWDVFGLPRIVTCEDDLLKIAAMNPSIYNGFTFCTGSLGSNLNNDLPKIIRNPKIAERIHFAHLRNIKYENADLFHEVSHLSSDGNFDMYEIVKALIDMGFDGCIRPDHGRMIWDEQARPGYGLYDRALGVAYLNGLWEAIHKNTDRMSLLDLKNRTKERDMLWEKKGYSLPEYNREEVKKATKEAPSWIHFGAGNIFRAFPAAKLQELLNEGSYDRGVIVAESFDHEIIQKAYKPYDGLSLSVVLKADGTIEKNVVGSVVESLVADPSEPDDFKRLTEIFKNPSLQMATFTITEKGYSLVNGKGEKLPGVDEGMQAGPGAQSHLMGRIATLCYERFVNGGAPLALVSTDNCSHNGDKLKAGVMAYVNAWKEEDKVGDSFVSYMKESISFPWSMIDKITPRPDADVQHILEKDGFEDTELIVTKCNTYTAPFVNSEETGYLVIEDDFPNGRPPLEKAGILFTDRETVDKVEKMKVCTCLNPLHTALAIYGCMLGYTSIHDEMEDKELHKLIETMCYREGMPVVTDPGVINPKDFAKAVLELRLPNPFMPDSPQRIACDTSQKLPIRFGETIKAYWQRENLNTSDLTLIPLVIAGWCRYLMGVDDEGNVFEQSPDPRLEDVKAHVAGLELGKIQDVHAKLQPILSDATIFAVNLYEVGLGEKIEGMFTELAAGTGAVRTTLKKYTS